jgi:hypothetical protein
MLHCSHERHIVILQPTENLKKKSYILKNVYTRVSGADVARTTASSRFGHVIFKCEKVKMWALL